MINIDLEQYQGSLNISEKEGKRMVFDPIRKKHLALLPEELVRQSWIQFLVNKYKISPSSIGIEKQFMVGNRPRRFDLVLFQKAIPHVLFEFKSYKASINNDTCFQAAQYNLELKVPFMVVSNGVVHHAFEIDYENQSFQELMDLSFL